MSRIVIIGGHGKVALLAAPLLVEAGHEVVSIIRNPDQAADITATGATPLVLSIEDADVAELTRAFTGADAIVWSAGAGGKGGPQRTDAVDRAAAIRSMEAAAAAGVKRYVMVSFITAYGEVADDHPLRAYAIAKIAADRHLQTTGLDWTILGPGLLTLEEPTGAITVARLAPGSASDSGRTSRANVARTIAAVLAEPASIGKVIPFYDGDTPIAQAVADVPQEYADLS
ncbi:SDR family oxidoreductase [Actinomyces sp. ZJ308]|uniref:SDR family oxidoreductase n=1 Tax=Actinomyces sp. ZJ308 TaxID=2708342 RepID=UPI001423FCA4|nr:SDR family oxidoreductase [Actinomyces sp. ZJ308]